MAGSVSVKKTEGCFPFFLRGGEKMKKITWLLILMLVSFSSLVLLQNIGFAEEKAIPKRHNISETNEFPKLTDEKEMSDPKEILGYDPYNDEDDLGSGEHYYWDELMNALNQKNAEPFPKVKIPGNVERR
jgi:hypothetical protein